MSTEPGENEFSNLGNDLEFLLDAITDYGIVRLDVNGNVTHWGGGAQSMLGYTAVEVLGKPTSIFYTDKDQAQQVSHAELTAAREAGRCEFEGWRVRKDGGISGPL